MPTNWTKILELFKAELTKPQDPPHYEPTLARAFARAFNQIPKIGGKRDPEQWERRLRGAETLGVVQIDWEEHQSGQFRTPWTFRFPDGSRMELYNPTQRWGCGTALVLEEGE